MYFFTSDEHYWHTNIIKYCNRPFENVEQMNETMIANLNSVVKSNDTVVHAGDFALCTHEEAAQIIKRLNGRQLFLNGDHDYWMGKKRQWEIFRFKMVADMFTDARKEIDIIVCHYCLRTWFKSHFNSWHVFGHTHGRLEPIGKSWDIGVDNNNFYPVSFDQLREIMSTRPDNPNLVKKE